MSGSSSGIFGSAGGRLSPNGEEDVGCQAPESLWPDPHDARFIVLTEQLPVCALGANLPLLQPRYTKLIHFILCLKLFLFEHAIEYVYDDSDCSA